MRAIAYFYDKYGWQGTSIAGLIWPLFFTLFYFGFEKRIFPSLIASFTLSSFMALFYFREFISSFIFFCGVGILVFGSLMLSNPTRNNKILFLIGIPVCGLIGLFVKFLNDNFYPDIPDRNYIENTNFIFSKLNSYLFTIPFVIVYMVFLIYF